MIALIIGAHGKFSKELLKSSELIYGHQNNVECVSFEPGEGLDDLIGKYKGALNNIEKNDGVIFMVDLFGGSPYNAASRVAITHDNMDVISGVNLPMLLEAYTKRESMSVDKLVEYLTSVSKDGIKSLKANLKSCKEEF